MITLGVAADEAEAGIGANCLWPRTLIATAAVQNLLGGDEAMRRARTPEIYADAAYEVLQRDPRECTGNAYIDDEVLAEAGITDLSGYQADPSGELALDLFVDGWPRLAAREALERFAATADQRVAVSEQQVVEALPEQALGRLANLASDPLGVVTQQPSPAPHRALRRC